VKCCIVEISRACLGNVLQLPPEAYVRAMHVVPAADALQVTIEGMGDEVHMDGQILRIVAPHRWTMNVPVFDWSDEQAGKEGGK